MLSNAIDKLKDHALKTLAVSVVSGITAALFLAENYLAQYIKTLAPVIIVRLLALLFLVALSFGILLLFTWPHLKFDSRIGIYRDRKTGLFYCPSCRSKKLRSPLKQEEKGWRCVVRDCMMFYSNPSYVDPKKSKTVSPTSRGKSWSATNW